MNKVNKAWFYLAFLLIVCVGLPVGAQVVLNVLQLQDFKSNGTAVGYFHQTSLPRYIDFVRGTKYSGNTMKVGVQSAIMDPDLGLTEGPNGVVTGTVGQARPTCDAAHRFATYTTTGQTNKDLGLSRDTTYQCCWHPNLDAGTGTFEWVLDFCS